MNQYRKVMQEHSPEGLFVLSRLSEEGGVLSLLLTDRKGNNFCLTFDYYFAFRMVDERDAGIALSEIARSGGFGSSFYIVDESDFIKWFHTQSYGLQDSKAIRHFVILTVDDVIDVLAVDEPEFRALATP